MSSTGFLVKRKVWDGIATQVVIHRVTRLVNVGADRQIVLELSSLHFEVIRLILHQSFDHTSNATCGSFQDLVFFFFFVHLVCPMCNMSVLLFSCPFYPSTRCLTGFTGHRCEQAVLKKVSNPKRMWPLYSVPHVITGVSLSFFKSWEVHLSFLNNDG